MSTLFISLAVYLLLILAIYERDIHLSLYNCSLTKASKHRFCLVKRDSNYSVLKGLKSFVTVTDHAQEEFATVSILTDYFISSVHNVTITKYLHLIDMTTVVPSCLRELTRKIVSPIHYLTEFV